jgi:hypothetical protein
VAAGGCAAKDRARWLPVLDVVFVVVTLSFFAVSWLYVRACDRV